MLKKKGGPRADGSSTIGKQMNQAGIAEEAVEELCDVLSMNPGKGKGRFLDAWLLDSGVHTTCAKRRSSSSHISLLKEVRS